MALGCGEVEVVVVVWCWMFSIRVLEGYRSLWSRVEQINDIVER